MKYNQSFLILMYVCMMMQSLCAMELSSDLTNLPKIKMIHKLSDESDDSKSFYGAYYSDSKTIIVMNKEEGCLAINNQGEKIKKISGGHRFQFVEPTMYRKLGVKQDGESVLVVRRKDIAICDINTDEQKSIREKSVHSVCFGLGALGNNHIFILSEDNDGALKKYTKDGQFINKLKTRHPENINFIAYEDACKSILCVIEKNDHVGQIFKLYNASDLSWQATYSGSSLIGGDDFDFDIPCQISENGFVALVKKDKKGWGTGKLFIFEVTDKYELCLKNLIECESTTFYNIFFYPTTSIISTISMQCRNGKFQKVIRYYDINTKECLHEALIDDYAPISSISFRPDGKAVLITTQNSADHGYNPIKGSCIAYEVPDCISDKHAHQMIPRIWFVNEVCEKMQIACNQIIPKEVRQIIAYKAYKA